MNIISITHSTFDAIKNTNPCIANDEAKSILLLLKHILKTIKNYL